MFDYQAGEKYKLTLIMVGMAGLMAGMFFSFLLMPSGEGPQVRKHRQLSERDMRILSDPDVTGHARAPGDASGGGDASQQGAGAANAAQQNAPAGRNAYVDRFAAKTFIDQWLPLAWDLSAGSAKASQAKAIEFMTPACQAAYTQSIWTPDLANQIEEAGLKSTFQPKRVEVSDNLNDGSVVIYVTGNQTLGVPGGPGKAREVHLEYMLQQTNEGIKIAGISDKGQSH
jgi:hypothetical protein